MKNIFIIIITIVISCHLNAMEPQTAPCFFKNMPTDIMDLIASFLTFDDVETEEEFIDREKTTSQYEPEKLLNDKETRDEKIEKPISWLKKHKTFEDKEIEDHNVYFVVYSPDNAICAMTYGDPCLDQTYYLSIIDTKTKQELHNIGLRNNDPNKYYFHFAISSSRNIFATIYSKKMENKFFKSFIKIHNLYTQKEEEYPNLPENIETIAFNKQGTHLIMHSIRYDFTSNTHVLEHTIFPLTTTLDNNHTMPQKTLSHYFEQKMICKNFTLQSQNSSII